jgi:predicted lipoprotein with Yx(FWY)xxD motif
VGTVLTTGAGLTLYRFTANPAGMSTCTGSCAKIWPPLLAAKGDHVSGPRGVKGLSLIDVGGGHWQVAFHDVALYRFEGDAKKGQAKGQGIAHEWFAVLKSGIPAGTASGTAAAGTGAGSTPTTPTTAAAGSTTTQAPPAATSPPAPAQTPVTQAPAPAPAPTTTPTTTSPPTTTTPTTQPPSTTTTMGGGYGY